MFYRILLKGMWKSWNVRRGLCKSAQLCRLAKRWQELNWSAPAPTAPSTTMATKNASPVGKPSTSGRDANTRCASRWRSMRQWSRMERTAEVCRKRNARRLWWRMSRWCHARSVRPSKRKSVTDHFFGANTQKKTRLVFSSAGSTISTVGVKVIYCHFSFWALAPQKVHKIYQNIFIDK